MPRSPTRIAPLLALAGLAPAAAQVAAPVLKWQHGGCYASWCETGWYSSPAVADLDADGDLDGDGDLDLARFDELADAIGLRASAGGPGLVFFDTFEGSDTTAWSSPAP